MKSRVHPKYETRYRVTNWREYERGLVQRGDVTIWLSPGAIAGWKAKPSGCRGAQPKFSDLAIETALTLRFVFHLALRQAEGFRRSLFRLMGVSLEVPDHTTLSRRSAELKVSLAPGHRGGREHEATLAPVVWALRRRHRTEPLELRRAHPPVLGATGR